MSDNGKSGGIFANFDSKQLLMAGIFLLVMSYVFGLKLALALMAILFLHELGHAWAIRRCGLPVAGFYFLPLMGLAVVPGKPWESRRDETFIAFMGPVSGLALAAVIFGAYWVFRWPLLAGLAGYAAWVNLFNLLPVNPLDGGRVIKSVGHSFSRRLGLGIQALGLLAAVGLGLWLSPLIAIFIGFAGWSEFKRDWFAYRIKKSRRQVLRELARELRVPAHPAEVIGALQDMLEDGNREAFAILADVGVPLEGLDKTPDRFLSRMKLAALPIGQFLLAPELPPMSKRGAALAFLGFLALAGALFLLAHFAGQIMSFMDLMQAMG